MKAYTLVLFALTATLFAVGQNNSMENKSRIISTIDSSRSNEIVLIQEFIVNVPIDSVWNTFTTAKGWESAFVAIAEIDFRIGGTIKSSYNKNATIGDSTTIVNHIVNFVPKKILTLQAEISENFPEFMKAEAKNFYNVIYFEELNEGKTKITSFGIGYRNNSKYLSLLKFFIQGNEASYLNLINYLEKGIAVQY